MKKTYITKKILGFKDPNVIINNFSEINNQIIVDIELKPQVHSCPNCKKYTNSIHDYRNRKFKHGKVNEYFLIVNYKRRRYKCFSCNKQFPERNLFIDRYSKISNQLNNILIKNLIDIKTFKQIAKENNVSSSTVIRRFDKHYTHIKNPLPEYLSFDEFKKSNSNSQVFKYALAIADPVNKKIIDIIGNRRKFEFDSYLKTIQKEALESVKVIIIDMWDPYRDLSYKYFPNAKIVIDRFHYIRNIIWALNDVRVRTMNNYNTNQKGYIVLKRPEFYSLAKLFINWKKEIAFSLCLENNHSNNIKDILMDLLKVLIIL